MKRLMCVVAVLMANPAGAAPEGMAFNALDRDDPLHAEYQRNLCVDTAEQAARFRSAKWWLDHLDPKMASMSPESREAWVADYVITTRLSDDLQARFDANCR